MPDTTHTLTSEAKATIIGISSSILVVLGSIVFVIFFVLYRRKMNLNNNQHNAGVRNHESSSNGGEVTTRNVTSCQDDEDDVSQTIDICSGENDGHQAGLVALDPDHLSQLSKLFSVTIGKVEEDDEDVDHDGGEDDEHDGGEEDDGDCRDTST